MEERRTLPSEPPVTSSVYVQCSYSSYVFQTILCKAFAWRRFEIKPKYRKLDRFGKEEYLFLFPSLYSPNQENSSEFITSCGPSPRQDCFQVFQSTNYKYSYYRNGKNRYILLDWIFYLTRIYMKNLHPFNWYYTSFTSDKLIDWKFLKFYFRRQNRKFENSGEICIWSIKWKQPRVPD